VVTPVTAIRRVLLLALVSVSGIALLAPLAARSAAPMAPAPIDHLLADAPAVALDLDRSALSGRDAAVSAGIGMQSETIEAAPIPTPASAPMEATLHTVPTPKPVAAAPAAPAPAPQSVVTYDGNTVWDALAQCESGGNWAINTGNGYYGGLQFSLSTWQGYGGGEFAAYPHEATREQQIIVAERLRAARGYQPWPACRLKLGLP
jgi:hypothetical protein